MASNDDGELPSRPVGLVAVLSVLIGLWVMIVTTDTEASVVLSGPTSSTTPPLIVQHEPTDYRELAAEIAQNHGLNVQLFTATIQCETAGTWNPDIQSMHRYPTDRPDWGVKAGDRELSFGLAQFHLPAHNITVEQAQDPEFALHKMADLWVAGKQYMWTCYRILTT